jgi:cytochrome o ubiquinol oxidase subunit III
MKVNHNDKPLLGFWLYLMSDCVLFAGLFATYAVLQHATFGGPTAYDLADLPFVLTETLLLLTSSFTIGLSLLAGRHGRRGWMLAGLAATFALGAAFVGMELTEFRHLVAEGAGPSRSAFLSAFFALVGTHGLHVCMGLLWMLVVAAHALLRGLSEATLRRLTMLALFWHFLDIVWVCLFTFVYLIGALAL